jgi:hypothetical protein
MRLLNATTLKLEEFWNSTATPPYAILSHTWEQQEVFFQAMSNIDSASGLAGFSKIKACCREALADGYEWVWVDTCCIDKSSSAELSEAINSMYRWYKEAAICYAYLADVPFDDDLPASGSAFSNSRWFKRGWTLQELIAPKEVVFCSREWTKLGRRSDNPLTSLISEITRIDYFVLKDSKNVLRWSIAERMSWASRRETTRSEDIAYCLMGLFGVNMPLLYGEGEKAFVRLQEEILKRSNDHSLFAWTAPKPDGFDEIQPLFGGFLASSPTYFQNSNQYLAQNRFSSTLAFGGPSSMTNMGLCIDVPLFQVPGKNEFIAVLLCGSMNARKRFTGLRVCVQSLDRLLQKRSFGKPSGPISLPRACIAERDVYLDPIPLEVPEPRFFENSVPWVKIDWDSRNREVKAYVTKLYIPQDPIYSF